MMGLHRITLNPNDPVSDDEVVYRRVLYNKRDHWYEQDGTLKISPAAFNDDNLEPSVDRAILCNNDPRLAIGKSDKNGVISLVTKKIRAIVIPEESEIKDFEKYLIDVKPDPKPKKKHLSHALIVSKPRYKDPKHFVKVQESLAMLASERGWEIEPHID